MEALPRPVGTSTTLNADADDKSLKRTGAGPSPAVGVKHFMAANPSAENVAKLAVPMTKKTSCVDNLVELTGQVSVTRPKKKRKFKR
jgi:hypothetical protein